MEEKLLPKVAALYQAVGEMIEEGADVNEMKVSDITNRAGIGKGTAYDYFKNREDIISSAMVYQMDRICRQIEDKFIGLGSFSKMIRYVLDCMDEEIGKRDCFIRYIHILTDNSPISKSLKEKIASRDENEYSPVKLLMEMVDTGVKNGEIKENLPRDYMCMEIGSKMIVYAMYLESRENKNYTRPQIHEFIMDSLLREFNA